MMSMSAALPHETFYPQHLTYPTQQFSTTADGQFYHAMGHGSASMVMPQYYLSEGGVYSQPNSLVAPNQLYGSGMVMSSSAVAMHPFFPGQMVHPNPVHLATPAAAGNPYLLSTDPLQQYSLQQLPQQFQPVYSNSVASQQSFSVAANQQRRSTGTFLNGQQQHNGGTATDQFNHN